MIVNRDIGALAIQQRKRLEMVIAVFVVDAKYLSILHRLEISMLVLLNLKLGHNSNKGWIRI